MPVSSPQPVNTPVVDTDIDATWGQGVSESTLQRFASAAERDTRWLSPPDNAMCFHDGIPWIFVKGQGKWRPALIQQFSRQLYAHGNGWGNDTQMSVYWPTMPRAAYDAMYVCKAEGYGGYSGGGTGSYGYALYDNNLASPAGGGWYQQAWTWFGRPWQENVPYATWAELGTCQIICPVNRGQQPGTIVRQGWTNGANMHLLLRMSWMLIPRDVGNYRVFTMGNTNTDQLDRGFQLGGN